MCSQIPFVEKDEMIQLKIFIWLQIKKYDSQADFVVEPCNALVGPVFAQCGQDVTQGVWPTAGQKKSDITQ